LALLEDFLSLGGHPFAVFFVFVRELAVGKFLEEEILCLVFFNHPIGVLDGEDFLASEAQVALAFVVFIKLGQMLYHDVDLVGGNRWRVEGCKLVWFGMIRVGVWMSRSC
jgi:hypothetical protein